MSLLQRNNDIKMEGFNQKNRTPKKKKLKNNTHYPFPCDKRFWKIAASLWRKWKIKRRRKWKRKQDKVELKKFFQFSSIFLNFLYSAKQNMRSLKMYRPPLVFTQFSFSCNCPPQ